MGSPTRHQMVRGDVSITVTDLGDCGACRPPLLLIHGLAGSARELIPTGEALSDHFRVLLMDQRGHGSSTRRPEDLSRQAFVDDVVTVLEEQAAGQACVLVGQSMGGHTALMTAAQRPDLVDRLVLLEAHAAGNSDGDAAAAIAQFFASWPTPFASAESARAFLGEDAIAKAWVHDLEPTSEGLRPRFDADVMQSTIQAVHEPRWKEWESLDVPTLAVFARDGMFSAEQKDELILRRPVTARADLAGGSHDAHLDAFQEWIAVLKKWLIDGL